METGKKTASSLEEWLEIMKQAHTNEEYQAALHSLPDRQTQDLWLEETESQLSSIMALAVMTCLQDRRFSALAKLCDRTL